jgi:hypothetical protein
MAPLKYLTTRVPTTIHSRRQGEVSIESVILASYSFTLLAVSMLLTYFRRRHLMYKKQQLIIYALLAQHPLYPNGP